MPKNHVITLLSIIFISTIIVVGIYFATLSKNPIAKTIKPLTLQQHTEQLFQQWLAKQNPRDIQDYQQLLVDQVKQPPSLFELSFNSHPPSKECIYSQFSLPPRIEWQNIIKPLKIIERLQAENLIGEYKVVSLYRDRSANSCIRGAKASKHLDNSAIDIQLIDSSALPSKNIESEMCHFWRKHGASLKMGLGIYGDNKFHIDAKGFRTWGKNYKGDSSPCLRPRKKTE
jgi:hypothetical protein